MDEYIQNHSPDHYLPPAGLMPGETGYNLAVGHKFAYCHMVATHTASSLTIKKCSPSVFSSLHTALTSYVEMLTVSSCEPFNTSVHTTMLSDAWIYLFVHWKVSWQDITFPVLQIQMMYLNVIGGYTKIYYILNFNKYLFSRNTSMIFFFFCFLSLGSKTCPWISSWDTCFFVSPPPLPNFN